MSHHLPIWRKKDGEIIACTEKIKVMQQNMTEILQTLQDAYEDAILMDIDDKQVKDCLHLIVDKLTNPYEDD